MENNSLEKTARYDAFDSVVTTADVNTYLASGFRNPGSKWIIAIVLLGFLSSLFFIIFLFNFFGELISNGSLDSSDLKEQLVGVVLSCVFAAPIIPLYFLYKRNSAQAIKKIIRLQRFAAANGWEYLQSPNDLDLNGSIFTQGTERRTMDIIRSNGKPQFLFGTHDYVTGSGRARSTNVWGFIAVDINADIPHTIFDAKANNGKVLGVQLFSNLPTIFDKNQQVSVNPGFDQLYTTYTTDKNAVDLTSIFNEEVVAKLQTLSVSYDIEVIDRKVYVYHASAFKMTKEITSEVLSLIDLIAQAFNVEVVRDTASLLEKQVTENTPAVLRGHSHRVLKAVGIFGVLIQFAALIGLLTL